MKLISFNVVKRPDGGYVGEITCIDAYHANLNRRRKFFVQYGSAEHVKDFVDSLEDEISINITLVYLGKNKEYSAIVIREEPI